MNGNVGNRLRWVRKRWTLTIDELAVRADIAPEELRQIADGTLKPTRATIQRLADALYISAEWLLTGVGGPIGLAHMTQDEQIKAQSGPGTEGLPGFVVTRGGPWYRNGNGRWQVVNRSRGA